MPVKQLQGMPTIQSAVGILLGTFAVIGKKMQETTLNVSLIHAVFLPCTAFYEICIAWIPFLSLSGTILVVVFVRLFYQNPKEPIKTNQETVLLKIAI